MSWGERLLHVWERTGVPLWSVLALLSWHTRCSQLVNSLGCRQASSADGLLYNEPAWLIDAVCFPETRGWNTSTALKPVCTFTHWWSLSRCPSCISGKAVHRHWCNPTPHLASSLHNGALSCMCGWHAELWISSIITVRDDMFTVRNIILNLQFSADWWTLSIFTSEELCSLNVSLPVTSWLTVNSSSSCFCFEPLIVPIQHPNSLWGVAAVTPKISSYFS